MSHALLSISLPLLPSFRRQQLLLEFASLKYRCPEGIYLTPNPNDPASWSGVYFVREGPYSSAILRFELLFPPSYPEAPPLVIFSTEIFHPLLVPLTTYAFTSTSGDVSATYSASETERLPPGALSLKYGFPHWFRTTERGRTAVRIGDGESSIQAVQNGSTVKHQQDDKAVEAPDQADKGESTTIRLLNYIKSIFEEPQILDDLPVELAGNHNAWHAWRSHRGLSRRVGRSESPSTMTSARTGTSPRNPADWDWDGVWEARVRNGIEESISDGLLFGSKNMRSGISSNEPIRFMKFDDEKLSSIQEEILRLHGFPAGL